MPEVLLEFHSISGDLPVRKMDIRQKKILIGLLKGLEIELTGYRSFAQALVTSGGIEVSEIDPRTMGSKIVEGLYFAGEIIDVDGLTGGFNLQIAWTTGYAAGMSC